MHWPQEQQASTSTGLIVDNVESQIPVEQNFGLIVCIIRVVHYIMGFAYEDECR